MLKTIEGDLLDSKEQYIVHCCNCVSKYCSGIAASIFSKYTYSNIYLGRIIPDKPGDIIVKGNGADQRYVINLMGQYYPGYAEPEDHVNEKLDGVLTRQNYFFQGLRKIAKISNLESVALPVGICCGLAGGDWREYFKIIEKFADYVKVDVVLYKLNLLKNKS